MFTSNKNKYLNLAIYKIEKFLNDSKITKKEFLEKLGLSKNSFYKWKKGSKPKYETFKKLISLIPDLKIEDFITPYQEKWSKYDNFYNKIYEGDALYWLKKIPDDTIHLIVTSPPYNAGHNYDNYNDTLEWNEYKKFLKDILYECYRILVKGGRLAINVPFAVKNKKTKEVRFLATTIASICEEIGFKEFEFITWHKGKDKNHFQGNNTAWGSWKSPSNPVFRPLGEVIMVFAKEQTKLIGDKENIDLTAEEFKEWTKNIWYLEDEEKHKDEKNFENVWFIVNNQKKEKHPCPFPEELVKRIIKLYSYKGNIVLDPFNGIGTTTKVAFELERKFIGIDLSKTYCEIARKKIEYLQQNNSSFDNSLNLTNTEQLKIFKLENSNLKDLVNTKNITNEPINRWFFYKESYSENLVENILARYNLNPKTLLDPFMGAGSTLFSAFKNGIKGYGFDVNPISLLSTKVKCNIYTEKDIKELENILGKLKNIQPVPQKIPDWTPLLRYIDIEKLNLLLTLRKYIENIKNKKISDLLKLLWLDLIEKVSNYKKDGNGIKYIVKNISISDIYEIFEKKIEIAINDIKMFKLKNKSKIFTYLDSSMNINKYKISNIDALITSPPYANMFDYFEVYKVELWLGGFISSYEEWKKYKKIAMRNNLNSLISPEHIIDNKLFLEVFNTLQKKVMEGTIKDKRIPIMVANYFYDIYILLKNVKNKINSNGILSFVVGNSAYGGIIIPTDEIIAEIGKDLGYNIEEILIARNLRTSSQQMKIIKDKSKLRESIVTLRKVI